MIKATPVQMAETGSEVWFALIIFDLCFSLASARPRAQDIASSPGFELRPFACLFGISAQSRPGWADPGTVLDPKNDMKSHEMRGFGFQIVLEDS